MYEATAIRHHTTQPSQFNSSYSEISPLLPNVRMWGPQRSVVTACFGIAILSSCVNAFAPHCSSVRHSKFTISNKPDHSPFPQRIHGENQPHRCSRLLASKSEPVPGFGDDGCALPSPSKVNTLPLPAQAAVFFGIWLGLYGGTAALVAGQFKTNICNWNSFSHSSIGCLLLLLKLNRR